MIKMLLEAKMQPTYTINLKKLEENFKNFSQIGEVFFPVKTNSNPLVLKKLNSLGSGFECDCVEHIKKVLNKRNAKKIIFSNVVKTPNDIAWSIKHGIIFYTVDDPKTLQIIFKTAQQFGVKHLKINVRLNVFEVFKNDFEKKGIKDSELGAKKQEVISLLKKINDQNAIKVEKGITQAT